MQLLPNNETRAEVYIQAIPKETGSPLASRATVSEKQVARDVECSAVGLWTTTMIDPFALVYNTVMHLAMCRKIAEPYSQTISRQGFGQRSVCCSTPVQHNIYFITRG